MARTSLHRPTLLFFAVIGLSPALLGADCIEYDERFGTATSGGAANGGAPGGNTDASGGGQAFVPGDPCGEPKLAMVDIADRKFKVKCGCAEKAADGGKVCTVPAGTTVRWTFLDAEDHNVAATAFGTSGEKASGTFEKPFPTVGTFNYSCSLHGSMKGYSIVVK